MLNERLFDYNIQVFLLENGKFLTKKKNLFVPVDSTNTLKRLSTLSQAEEVAKHIKPITVFIEHTDIDRFKKINKKFIYL